jgi:hypothetical protein
MLNELRTQRVALSREVDQTRAWRKSAALDPIKKALETRLAALDKEIKTETERVALEQAAE